MKMETYSCLLGWANIERTSSTSLGKTSKEITNNVGPPTALRSRRLGYVPFEVFRFRVREGRRFRFGKQLVGRDNNLVELKFVCIKLGYEAVKLLIHFHEFSVDRPPKLVSDQSEFLSDDFPLRRINYIPWDLHLVQSSDDDALLQLERRW